MPELQLNFNEKPIKFKEVREKGKGEEIKGVVKELLEFAKRGENSLQKACLRARGKSSFFNAIILNDERVPNTITSNGQLPTNLKISYLQLRMN